MSTKPTEQLNPPERKPPPTPTTTATPNGEADGRPKEASGTTVLDGEIIVGDMSFDEFWLATGRKGAEGFARSEWRKLSSDDRFAIGQRLQSDSRVQARNVWAGVWLRDRLWEQADPPREHHQTGGGDCGFAAIAFALRQREQFRELMPHTPEWVAERERRVAARLSVSLMDDWASQGRGWGVRT